MSWFEIYQVDAFTDQLFKGNAAAVVPLSDWLADDVLLAIAQENNLSETAYVKTVGDGHVEIRWFSPLCEIDFCGHATLAAALVMFNRQPDLPKLIVDTRFVGQLAVTRHHDGWFELDFPQRAPVVLEQVPAELLQGLTVAPLQVLRNQQAYFAVYDDASVVQSLAPDLLLLKQLAPYDVVVTAPGKGVADDQFDMVSRYFWPANGGDEDPVTGSIHAGLAPYWAERLGKTELLAYQASKRGGLLKLTLQGERVLVKGQAVLYLEGKIRVPQA